jgi:hypothetical protein
MSDQGYNRTNSNNKPNTIIEEESYDSQSEFSSKQKSSRKRSTFKAPKSTSSYNRSKKSAKFAEVQPIQEEPAYHPSKSEFREASHPASKDLGFSSPIMGKHSQLSRLKDDFSSARKGSIKSSKTTAKGKKKKAAGKRRMTAMPSGFNAGKFAAFAQENKRPDFLKEIDERRAKKKASVSPQPAGQVVTMTKTVKKKKIRRNTVMPGFGGGRLANFSKKNKREEPDFLKEINEKRAKKKKQPRQLPQVDPAEYYEEEVEYQEYIEPVVKKATTPKKKKASSKNRSRRMTAMIPGGFGRSSKLGQKSNKERPDFLKEIDERRRKKREASQGASPAPPPKTEASKKKKKHKRRMTAMTGMMGFGNRFGAGSSENSVLKEIEERKRKKAEERERKKREAEEKEAAARAEREALEREEEEAEAEEEAILAEMEAAEIERQRMEAEKREAEKAAKLSKVKPPSSSGSRKRRGTGFPGMGLGMGSFGSKFGKKFKQPEMVIEEHQEEPLEESVEESEVEESPQPSDNGAIMEDIIDEGIEEEERESIEDQRPLEITQKSPKNFHSEIVKPTAKKITASQVRRNTAMIPTTHSLTFNNTSSEKHRLSVRPTDLSSSTKLQHLRTTTTKYSSKRPAPLRNYPKIKDSDRYKLTGNYVVTNTDNFDSNGNFISGMRYSKVPNRGGASNRYSQTSPYKKEQHTRITEVPTPFFKKSAASTLSPNNLKRGSGIAEFSLSTPMRLGKKDFGNDSTAVRTESIGKTKTRYSVIDTPVTKFSPGGGKTRYSVMNAPGTKFNVSKEVIKESKVIARESY